MKAWKRSVYNHLCELHNAVVVHPIKLVITCYSSPRRFAILVAGLILSLFQLSNTMDEVFHCSIEYVLFLTSTLSIGSSSALLRNFTGTF